MFSSPCSPPSISLWNRAFHADDDGIRKLLKEHGNEIIDFHHPVSGYTPLMVAAASGHEGTTRVLLEFGADMNALNNAHEAPIHRAAGNGYATIVLILLQHHARTDLKDNAGLLPRERSSSEEVRAVFRQFDRDSTFAVFMMALHPRAGDGSALLRTSTTATHFDYRVLGLVYDCL